MELNKLNSKQKMEIVRVMHPAPSPGTRYRRGTKLVDPVMGTIHAPTAAKRQTMYKKLSTSNYQGRKGAAQVAARKQDNARRKLRKATTARVLKGKFNNNIAHLISHHAYANR
tara:strand:- start:4663 stop:5001 length:339 start_codon:yes stop_codon:yes gene_type:complete